MTPEGGAAVPLKGARSSGHGVTVKPVLLVAVTAFVVTEIGPVVAFDGTVAVIDVLLFTVRVGATVPLNFTTAPLPKPVPVMPTDAPVAPLVGVKPVTVGAAVTVKLELLVAVPFATAATPPPRTTARATTGQLPRARRMIIATFMKTRPSRRPNLHD